MKDFLSWIAFVMILTTYIFTCYLSSGNILDIKRNQESIISNQQTIILNQSRMMPQEADRTWSTKKSILDKIK